MARVTEYHGKPVTTEYLLTADCAREFMENDYEVRVEAIYHRLATALTGDTDWYPAMYNQFGKRRADIALMHDEHFLNAVIEIKIGASSLKSLIYDLGKITKCFSFFNLKYRSQLIGASIFQVHVAGHDRSWEIKSIRRSFARKITKIRAGLATHATMNTRFNFRMISLQSPCDGIVEREIENDPSSGERTLGQHGHITRYYAIIVRPV